MEPHAAHMLLVHCCPDEQPPHATAVPQLLVTLPHFPAQVVAIGSGVHAHVLFDWQVLGGEQSLLVQQPAVQTLFPQDLKPLAHA